MCVQPYTLAKHYRIIIKLLYFRRSCSRFLTNDVVAGRCTRGGCDGTAGLASAGGAKFQSASTRPANRPCARFSTAHRRHRQQQFFADTSPALSANYISSLHRRRRHRLQQLCLIIINSLYYYYI